MASDPADVSSAPVHIVMVMIKNILEGQRCVKQIPSNRVENTLYHTGKYKRELVDQEGSKRQAAFAAHRRDQMILYYVIVLSINNIQYNTQAVQITCNYVAFSFIYFTADYVQLSKVSASPGTVE